MPSGLGIWLRRARETRQITLEEAEQQLRIRKRYLQALENGDYDALPGPVQARGFLRNYARFLGLPVEEALARYEADISGRPVQPRLGEQQAPAPDRPSFFAPPSTAEEETKRKPTFSPILLLSLLGIAVFFALIALAGLIYLRFFSTRTAAPYPTPQPTATVVAPTTGEATLTPPTFVPSADGMIHIHLEPREHAWVRVTADDEIVFQGIAAPDQSIDAVAHRQCLVETGNGGAFHLYVNDVDWGTLGPEGKVARRAWTPNGETAVESSP